MIRPIYIAMHVGVNNFVMHTIDRSITNNYLINKIIIIIIFMFHIIL